MLGCSAYGKDLEFSIVDTISAFSKVSFSTNKNGRRGLGIFLDMKPAIFILRRNRPLGWSPEVPVVDADANANADVDVDGDGEGRGESPR